MSPVKLPIANLSNDHRAFSIRAVPRRRWVTVGRLADSAALSLALSEWEHDDVRIAVVVLSRGDEALGCEGEQLIR
jgi:hypothetical protein